MQFPLPYELAILRCVGSVRPTSRVPGGGCRPGGASTLSLSQGLGPRRPGARREPVCPVGGVERRRAYGGPAALALCGTCDGREL